MKSFSITKLETARKSPANFAALLKSPSAQGGFGKSKYADWKNAIYYFHKTKDLAKTLDYFEKFFQKHFKNNRANTKDFEKYTKLIETYVSECKNENLNFVEAKKSIDLLIIKDKLELTGQAPIIYLNNKLSYSIYFFTKTSKDWEDELRFPVIQNYFAKEVYGVDVSEIEVGVFTLDLGKHLQKSYSKTEIKKAVDELNSIGNTIVNNL